MLVAEDDPDVQAIVRHALEADGCTVRVVCDGTQVLQAVEDEMPDLLVLDLMMPGMGGVDVLRELRRRPEAQRPPVLVLTARGGEDDIVACFELGARDYVTKPFMIRELRARAQALLSGHDKA